MGGPRFAEKFSGLLGEERRFGGLSYPYYSTGNFRSCRKLNLLEWEESIRQFHGQRSLLVSDRRAKAKWRSRIH